MDVALDLYQVHTGGDREIGGWCAPGRWVEEYVLDMGAPGRPTLSSPDSR